MIRCPLRSAALAAATFCLALPAAQAQSSVSLYGLLDASAGRFQNAGDTKVNALQSGNMATSFYGFSGKEQLSSSLKAKFAIEGFLRMDTGESGRFGGDAYWARAAWVGLEGDFGSTTLGRTTNQFFISTLIFNAFGDSFGYSPAIRQVLTPSVVHGQALPFLGDTGWNNSILYSSPSAGGLSFNLQGALGEGAAGNVGHNLGGNVLYFGGPFAATIAYQRVKQGLSFAPPIITAGFQYQDAAQIGLSYDAGFAKFFAQGSLIKTKATDNTKSKIYGAGVAVPLGAGKLLAQYGYATSHYPLDKNTSKTLTVGYDYDLSKRTDVYLVAMQDRFTGLSNGNTFAVGVKHKF